MEPSINKYPVDTESVASCASVCEQRHRCHYAVFDEQRGYCFMYHHCCPVDSEPYVSLALVRRRNVRQVNS